MLLGQRLRRGISEALFRRIFFWSLLSLGVYIALSSAAKLAG